jgi:hypothetical protein
VWASLEGSLYILRLVDGRALKAGRNILMLDLLGLFTHWCAGRSQVQLPASLGIDRKTVRKYLAPAIADGMQPGGEPLSAGQWTALIGGWFPELGDPAARASTWPLIAPHQDRINDWLDADVAEATIAQTIVLRVWGGALRIVSIALPPRVFELSTWSIGAVGVDAHLKIGKALYSVPWRLIGRRLHARTAGAVVQIFARVRSGSHPCAPPVRALHRLRPLPT